MDDDEWMTMVLALPTSMMTMTAAMTAMRISALSLRGSLIREAVPALTVLGLKDATIL